MSNLTILNTQVRQTNNLFNLKDLHLASGNEKKHEPYLFTRLETTKELIAEMQKEDPTATPLKVLRGTQGGTFACEELVIAYAMWISPKFHLIVLRAFLAMHKAKTQPKQLALPEPEPTINVEFKVSELRKIVNVWLQFTRFAESVYFLIRALGLNNDSAKHDERSVVFNHNLCKQNIKDTTLIMRRLAL